ncbi:MAG: hypothetical protein JSV03_16880 [Planctomycetota bacterium]|nr:MAG: hypothetical protein JSV03_16880 [Planctomycetota bacterium]
MKVYGGLLILLIIGLYPSLPTAFAVHTVLDGIDMYNPVDGSQHSDDVTYWNGVVYVAATGAFSASNTAYAVDVSDPNNLQLLSAVGASGPSQAKGVAVANNKLYVANWTSFLHIYDIYPDGSLNPNYWWLPDNGSPVLPTAAWGIDYDNQRLYIGSCDNSTPSINWRVYIVDVSEPYPANPGDAVISWIQLGDWHTGYLVARGSYLYYTDGNHFKIANISDEDSPYIMTTRDLGQLLLGVVIRDDYAYIFCHQAEPQTFYVYDISNPLSPSFVGNYSTGNGVNNIYLLGDYALLAGSWLHTVDISNPASPSAVGNTDLPEGYDECGQAQITRCNSVTGNGKYAYIGASESYPNTPCRGDNYSRGWLFVAQCFDHDPDNAGPADWSACSLGEASWDTQYHGDALPSSSDPSWEVFEGSEGWASVSNGELRINDTGTGSSDKIRWTRNWNATNTRGTTVMVRAKCASYDLHGSSISHLSNVFIEDGKYQMQLAVLSDRVRVNYATASPAEYALDGTIWRTYRITTLGDSFSVYLDEENFPVITGTLTSTSERARIMFGNGGSSAGPAEQDIYFDYVYAFSNGTYGPPDPTGDIAPTVSVVATDTKGKGSLSGINPATATVYWSTDGGTTWEQSGVTGWSCLYQADELPTDANPPWTEPEGNGVTAWVNSGILHVNDTVADWGAKVKWARSWGASASVGTTLLARVKCNSVVEDPYVGNLYVDDGALREHFKIMTDRIEVGETSGTYYLDGTDWHVYRITTENDQYQVYVDEVPTVRLSGTMTASSDQNRVMFGSGSSFATQYIEFDYVYYTTTGAFAPGEGPGGGGSVTVVCTGQPGDYAGTVTAHDIPLNQESKILNKVRFSLRDMAGNTGFSPVYNVHIAEPPSPDFDNDDDVDQEDFGRLQECFGADVISETECRIADFNMDYSVDQGDFNIFQSCMNGPDNTPLPGCVYY